MSKGPDGSRVREQGEHELYKLEDGISEARNVVSEYPERATAMERALSRFNEQLLK